MIAVFVLLLMMGVAMMAYLYWWQQQQKVVHTPSPPPRPSIAELHSECVNNPLNCDVGQVTTTIEEGDDEPDYYENVYGFKTNLPKMKQDLKDDGTCEDDECPEIKALEAKTLEISQEALRDSMNHCKLRLPGDRLRRIMYDGDKEVGREPITMLGARNLNINIAEKWLDKMIADETTTYPKYGNFLEAYGPGEKVWDPGPTYCDFYVPGCAVKESDVCHPDAIRKHKRIRANRPPIIEIPEEDLSQKLEESGLMVSEDGTIVLNVANQEVVEGASEEEKERIRQRFKESERVVEWMAMDLNGNNYLDNTIDSPEFNMIMGTTIRGATSSMGKAGTVMDENKNFKINRKEWFKFVDNIDMSMDKNNNDQIEFDEMLSHACSKYPDNKVCDGSYPEIYNTYMLHHKDFTPEELGLSTNAEIFKLTHELNVKEKGDYAPWYNENDRMDLNRDGIIDKLEYGIFDTNYKHRSNPDNYGFNLGTCAHDVICGQDY